MSQVVALLGMIISMIVAFSLDRWLNIIQKLVFEELSPGQFIWLTVITNLVMAGLWVWLGWWTLLRCRNCRLDVGIAD
jgi:hypothetical protein